MRLIGRWAFMRVPMMEARQRLDDAFRGVPEEERDARWEARHADINRCVIDVYGKEALKKDQASATGTSHSATDVLPHPVGMPLVWMKDMRPRMFAGGTLIKGFLDAGAMSVIYAPSNVGKSFFALDLAFHIASGREWRGHRVKKPGFVLYLAAEGGAGFINRVEAIKRHYDVPHDADIPLAVMPAGFSLLENSGDCERIIELVKHAVAACGHDVVMIVIDTLSRAMAGGDESSARDMTAVVRNIDRIREHVSAHVMIIHHAGKDVARGARGHSSLRAATDTEIEIARGAEGGDKFAIASVKKQRDMPGEDCYPFTLKQILFGFDEDGDPVTSAVVEPLDGPERKPTRKKPSGHAGRALDILQDVLRTGGAEGMPSAPEGVRSIEKDRWRLAFYEGAVPAAAQDTKQKAFCRASDSLVADKIVGMGGGRVWVMEEQS